MREVICEGQLTERHARALLSLPGEELRLRVARAAAAQHLSVQKTEQLIARTLEKLPMPLTCRRVVSLARDYRLYINAIRGIVGQLCDTGVQAQCEVSEYDSAVEVRIVLPRNARQKNKQRGVNLLTVCSSFPIFMRYAKGARGKKPSSSCHPDGGTPPFSFTQAVPAEISPRAFAIAQNAKKLRTERSRGTYQSALTAAAFRP